MNKYNPNIHHRRLIRLKGYDYAQAGLYFITFCVQDRQGLFGQIINGEMICNDAGKMVIHWYHKLENKFPDIKCHEKVVMPNHFHCIIENVGADLRVCPNDTGNPNENTNSHQIWNSDGNGTTNEIGNPIENGNSHQNGNVNENGDSHQIGNYDGNGNVNENGNSDGNGNHDEFGNPDINGRTRRFAPTGFAPTKTGIPINFENLPFCPKRNK